MSHRIDPDFLMRHAWRFSRGDGSLVAPILRLLPRGIVGGYIHPSERSWEMRGDHVALLNANDVATTLFTQVQDDASGPVKLTGTFLGDGKTVHVLDRVKMPSGADLGQQSQLEPVEFLRVPASASARRNLIVLRANENSVHTDWSQDIPSTERNWDLCISWYGKNAPPPDLACEYLTWQPEDRKFGAIHALFLHDGPLWQYDRFWLADDDLLLTWAAINRMFAIFRRHDFDLAQPSLSASGHITHPVTRQHPDYSLRYTNFVEGMCPILSRDTLRICLPIMYGSISGWGLDNIWPQLLGSIASKMAIIDEIAAIHTRPFGTGTNYNMNKAQLECDQLRALYGAPLNFEACGVLVKGLTPV